MGVDVAVAAEAERRELDRAQELEMRLRYQRDNLLAGFLFQKLAEEAIVSEEKIAERNRKLAEAQARGEVPVANGGTGAATASAARTALGALADTYRDLPITTKTVAFTFADADRAAGLNYTGAAAAATINPNATTAITTGACIVVRNAGEGAAQPQAVEEHLIGRRPDMVGHLDVTAHLRGVEDEVLVCSAFVTGRVDGHHAE